LGQAAGQPLDGSRVQRLQDGDGLVEVSAREHQRRPYNATACTIKVKVKVTKPAMMAISPRTARWFCHCRRSITKPWRTYSNASGRARPMPSTNSPAEMKTVRV